MYVTPLKREILQALRGGPLTHYEIAGEIGQAAFIIRDELKGLRAGRLVAFRFTGDGVLWQLTTRGHAAIVAGQQLELGA